MLGTNAKSLTLQTSAVCCQLGRGEQHFLCCVHTSLCPFPCPHLSLPTFAARKTKKKIKGLQQGGAAREAAEAAGSKSLVPASLPQLTPTLVSLLEVIEPEVLYSGYDSSLPDSSWRILSTLNMLGGRQVVAAVKWAKAIPGKGQKDRGDGQRGTGGTQGMDRGTGEGWRDMGWTEGWTEGQRMDRDRECSGRHRGCTDGHRMDRQTQGMLRQTQGWTERHRMDRQTQDGQTDTGMDRET